MAQINLAPGTQYAVAARKRRLKMYGLTALVVVIMVAVIGVLWMWQTSISQQLEEVEGNLRAVNSEIALASGAAREVELFEGRLNVLDNLLDSHVSWDPLWQELERLLPPPTVLKGVRAGVDERVVKVSGTTTDMDQLAQTLASLKDEEDRQTLFSEAKFGSTSRVEQKGADGELLGASYNFSAELTMKDSLRGDSSKFAN